ncbi:hypothetical protein B0T16DRAFT_386206 [Cercophora newfieldiana]|uniref:Uncharacterized protein n=1 Tax=Cercophora newfieldiana TaxID=92897 RepID=A0AA39YU98_9PEZI|nr:hypothetical protein B0T16DRAFT_386206 [Cercophora newfieldiana]
MASFGGLSGGASNKITKPRGKIKPILKKLSHSEKNSLDLDRGWEEQAIDQMEQSRHAWGGNYGSRSSSTKDVAFAFTAPFAAGSIDGHGHVDAGAGSITTVGGSAVGSTSRGKFQHGRSASQASTGSTSRGVFVHPFQQTPRTSTPPLSYANSLASFDNARDYSPTITENDDDELTQVLSSQPHNSHHPPPTHSQSNLRRPSLASQRTASFTDITSPAGPLRVATGRSTPGPASRLALGSLTTSASRSDLHLNLAAGGLDSPSAAAAPALASPSSSSAAPMSPLRSSLEAAGFPRLRSRSELDTAARAENIRAARRKFEERERAKEEKYDREMVRKRERRDNKQASRVEKESARKASSSEERPSPLPTIPPTSQKPAASRKSTPTNLSAASAPTTIATGGGLSFGKGFWGGGNGSRDALQDETVTGEKPPMTFASRQYESVPPGQASPPSFGPAPPPGASGVRFEQARPRRSSNAKRRTQSYWQGFILWLRTKFLRMGGGK